MINIYDSTWTQHLDTPNATPEHLRTNRELKVDFSLMQGFPVKYRSYWLCWIVLLYLK